MNLFTKNLKHKLRGICHRSTHDMKQEQNLQWIQPVGYETNIKVYNPRTKCTVPLILNNKNYLTWYVCGPTVYDSAHIGHAATYVKTDIIRRILSDYFNISTIMVMGITDIDDKIINRANETNQNFKTLSEHYEQEFIEDMKMLNVTKPNLYCRVTDFIPQIIKFINNILSKEKAYIGKSGSVYFDVSKHNMYGKLSTPFSDSSHSDKKSALDFTLWKAAKKGEPFWEAPWGNGRPGWHIECSTIASTIFGNSIDIHSGGIDLAFPHHENEEAQSCSYHEINQWVNYWVHCGHLFLKDIKMSKSLGNVISVRELLTKYTGNQFRMLCLLSNYKNDIEFSDGIMNYAMSMMNKIEHFLVDCDNYIAGRWTSSNVDEVTLLRCLHETKKNVDTALTNNFNTSQAIRSIVNLVDTTNKMLHDSSGSSTSRSIPAISTVASYVSTMLSKFGIENSNVADECKVNNLIEYFIKFRKSVRNRAREKDVLDKVLLAACDEARTDLSKCGVIVKDSANETCWSLKTY
ncbi:cysteine--tRNA ligase-like protein, mitochondrial isoform X2 [Nomia melanderi]|uniref:cysteine--tRNA ligase-like protein, mitochondrial isoform X2 n=1 Tax=Nomia melanderi TaxID=2448451 RepID=UPI00130412D4|nr:probable cysteine--tRNA ligase, mitochondrial isoform X2 [Nomia melanderi]